MKKLAWILLKVKERVLRSTKLAFEYEEVSLNPLNVSDLLFKLYLTKSCLI
jgi:hypothetical protein